MTPADLAAGPLAGRFDPTDAHVDQPTREALAALIAAKGYSLTGLARAMKRSHTWLLRKLDPDQASPRPTTLGDVAEVLSFLELEASALELPAAA